MLIKRCYECQRRMAMTSARCGHCGALQPSRGAGDRFKLADASPEPQSRGSLDARLVLYASVGLLTVVVIVLATRFV